MALGDTVIEDGAAPIQALGRMCKKEMVIWALPVSVLGDIDRSLTSGAL